MVWKISKHKRSEKQGSVLKQQQVLESQPKLKSCLKVANTKEKPERSESFNDSSALFQNDNSTGKLREQSTKSAGSRSRRSSADMLSCESRMSSLGFVNRKRVASVGQLSIDSRSWDRDSRKSETAQSIGTSERSVDSKGLFERRKKHVRFAEIHVRDYERVVGDNPSCTIGPPVGIGWKYGPTRVMDIDSFESGRMYTKSTSHLILTREEREALLLNWGASFHDIVEAVRGNLKIKNQRRQTVTNLGKVERIEEAFENATRKLKSALMLRRSTGNKVKRLQEQANLAQSALTSLKIAEDRALSEIRGTHRVQVVEEPESSEELGDFVIPSYSATSPDDAQGRCSHLIIPEEDYDPSQSHALKRHSSTPSELEIEKFYLELELEMFGEEELPSMVGQTLEVPLRHGYPSSLALEECSVTSGISEKYLDDALLEQERNRSMISKNLLEDTENESPRIDHSSKKSSDQNANHSYHPSHSPQSAHLGQIPRRNHSGWKSRSSEELSISTGTRMNRPGIPAEYQEPKYSQNQTVPLHAGMTMFEDCALLGGQKTERPTYREKKRHSSRSRDLNAGPKVQFMPLPNHLSPSDWLEGSDSNNFHRSHDTITICEDDHDYERHNGGRYRQIDNRNPYPPNFF